MDSKYSETATSFAEWRGTVKTALDFIKTSLARLEGEDQEQWETIEQVRGMLEKHRDRCDQISRMMGAKNDLEALQRDVLLKAPASEVAEMKKDLATKVATAEVEALRKELGLMGKAQIKQGVTMVFYGIIGGALFSILLALFNHVLNKN